MKEFTDLQFDILIDSFRKKYESLHAEGSFYATNTDAFTNDFINGNLTKRRNIILGKPVIGEIIQFKNQKSGLSELTNLDLIKLFCSDNTLDIEEVVNDIAEYEAILLVHGDLLFMNRHESSVEEVINLPNRENEIYLNEKVLSKIDYIRIIYTLAKMNAFKKENDTYPTIKEIMNIFGRTIGVNLVDYQKDLSKALRESPIETNIDIFGKLIDKMTAIHTSKLEKPD